MELEKKTSKKELYDITLNDYYYLKYQYMTSLRQIKNSINSKSGKKLSSEQKRTQYLKRKPKCVNCNRAVGTIFSEKDRKFQAKCGDKTDPCDLNIEIYIGKKEHVDDIINAFTDTIEEIKEKIIKLKMDLIYDYKTESDISDEFLQLKRDYMDLQKRSENLQRKKMDILTFNGTRDEIIASNAQKIKNIIGFIDKKIEEYKANKDAQTIIDVIKTYNDDLKTAINEERDNKYKKTYIETLEKDEKKLVQYENDYYDMYMTLQGEKINNVISNKK